MTLNFRKSYEWPRPKGQTIATAFTASVPNNEINTALGLRLLHEEPISIEGVNICIRHNYNLMVASGRTPVKVVANYLEDEESNNYGTLMEWKNPFFLFKIKKRR